MSRQSGDGTDAGRPVRPALSRGFIIRTALRIIDRDGVDSFSMRKLGAELDVDPMAIYYHIPNKGALFDGIVEVLYDEIVDFQGPATGDWRDQMLGFLRHMRKIVSEHPNALPIIATRPAYTPAILAFGERTLARCHELGMSAREMLVIINCLQAFTIGHVIEELGEPVGGPTVTPDEAIAAINLRDYPHFAEAIAGGYRPDEQYEQGLKAMLDGFGMARERPGPPRPEPGGPR